MTWIAPAAKDNAIATLGKHFWDCADQCRIGKASGSALRVHRLLQAQPILSIASAGEELKLSVPTVTASLKHLARLGIARETTGRNYGRIYAYDKYLGILNERTEPFI